MYRSVECDLWDQPWLHALGSEAKLLYFYLLTNPRSTACGAFLIPLDAMALETRLPRERLPELLEMLEAQVVWFAEYEAVWLPEFYGHQHRSVKFREGARRTLHRLPLPVQVLVASAYPELSQNQELSQNDDTVAVPSPEKAAAESARESALESETRLELVTAGEQQQEDLPPQENLPLKETLLKETLLKETPLKETLPEDNFPKNNAHETPEAFVARVLATHPQWRAPLTDKLRREKPVHPVMYEKRVLSAWLAGDGAPAGVVQTEHERVDAARQERLRAQKQAQKNAEEERVRRLQALFDRLGPDEQAAVDAAVRARIQTQEPVIWKMAQARPNTPLWPAAYRRYWARHMEETYAAAL